MAYTSPSEITRRQALLQALAGNQPEVDPRGPVSWTQGLAQMLGSYGARKGQEQLTGMENENQRLQSDDTNKLIQALRSGGMNEKSVTGMEGESLGTIPRKNYSFQTPEVGQMYAQALMSQEMNKQNNLLSPEEEAQKIRISQAGSNTGKYGLTPNLYQKADGTWVERIYNDAGNYTDREMPGEPVRGMTYNPTLQQDLSGAKQQGTKDVDLNMNPQIERATSAATVEGKNSAEQGIERQQRIAQFPRLEQVVKELSDLGQKATYTVVGQGVDSVQRQLGLDVGEDAIARKEYISKVDNEILPLLRQTFGAQFTQKEGESLKQTLGDPNASPAEKDAVLRSFIATKAAQIQQLTPLVNEPAGVPSNDGWSIE